MARQPRRNAELKGKRCGKCNGSGTVLADIGFLVEVDCSDCHGTGLVESPNACTECKGSGSVIAKMGALNVQATCSHCNGSGLNPES